MSLVKIKFPDGSEKEFEKGVTLLDIVQSIGGRLAKEALIAKVEDELRDLNMPVDSDATVEFITFNDEAGQKAYRHSTSHVMAQAVQKLFPGTKFAIGPAVAGGYYYDFDTDKPFTPEDLTKIEAEMDAIIKNDYPFERFEMDRQGALDYFKKNNQPYKVELIEDLPEDARLSFYKQGDFTDLCAGPHLPSTGRLKSIKLTSVAGAYWRGSERNKMLQRIYGTSFPKKSLLEEHLFRIEEAKRRDHRKLGAELELFSIMDEGPGFPFFHPKGMILRNELEKYWREEHQRCGYQEIRTPIILNRTMWENSGHWDHYQENMYFTKIDQADYAVKPMNCPGSILIYNSKLHSYRELPIRLAELGLVHRHEMSGVLHGLMRVRCFTQDDAHIFMLPEQIKEEIIGVIDLIDDFYSVFGFKYHVELSTRPENAMGTQEIWDMATGELQKALEDRDLKYVINPGDGAFYGPKIDFHLEDSLGRTWQCGTIQLDFQMPEKFKLTYVGEDGQKHQPVMIHRVVFGSIERFIGILIEHYAGAFPVWLAPVQVKIIPITDRHLEYAQKLESMIKKANIRVETDSRSEKVNYKIREAQNQKIPYMLVVGDKEIQNDHVSVRHRTKGDLGAIPAQNFINTILDEIENKSKM